jgi:hypothetical protein
MANKKTKPQESGKDQTPEQKIAALEAANAKLQSDLKKSQKETAAAKPKKLEFEVDVEDKDGKPTGKVKRYKVVVPLFDIDNVQFKADEIIEGYEAEQAAEESGPNSEALAKLVQMNSGIIELID